MDQAQEPILKHPYKTPEYIRKAAHAYRLRQKAMNEEEYNKKCREHNKRSREKRKLAVSTASM